MKIFNLFCMLYKTIYIYSIRLQNKYLFRMHTRIFILVGDRTRAIYLFQIFIVFDTV